MLGTAGTPLPQGSSEASLRTIPLVQGVPLGRGQLLIPSYRAPKRGVTSTPLLRLRTMVPSFYDRLDIQQGKHACAGMDRTALLAAFGIRQI